MAFETVSDLIKAFREDEKDAVAPFFWSDLQLVRFFNQALTEYAEKTMSVFDDSSPITVVDFSADQAVLDYAPQIIRVVEAVCLIGGRSEVLCVGQPGSVSRAERATGSRPRQLVVSEATNSMRLYPSPSEAGQVLLTVVRRPLKEAAKGDRISDAPAHKRHVLLLGIKHYAYRVADGDRFAPGKAFDFAAEFSRECQDIYEAELLRRKGASRPIKYRG